MAKLEGVKTLDMVNGEITKIEYDGAVYEKSEDVARVGDLVRSLVEALDITKGGFYEVVRTYNDGDVRVKDDVDAGHDRLKSTVDIFRKVSETASLTIEQIGDRLDDIDADVYALAERVDALENGGEQSKVSTETITFEGEEYTLVDRKAQPGDVVYVTEDAEDTCATPNKRYYRVNSDGEIGVDSKWTHPVYRDGHFNRTTDTVKVYEPIAGSDPKFKEGDIVVITANTNHSRNAVGDIGKVGDHITSKTAEVHVPGKTAGNGNRTLFNEMRPATDAEKAKYKQAVKLAELGRKPGEFKKGDIIKYKSDDEICEVIRISTEGKAVVRTKNHGTCYESEEFIELIAPVESRVDNVE